MTDRSHSENDTQWQDLYKVGGITAIVLVFTIFIAVIAYFIWPYAPGVETTESVFAAIQESRIGGLVALDVSLLVGMVIQVPLLLALYVALKPTNASYALLAVTLGMIAVVAMIPTRPALEMLVLSDRFAVATTEAARAQYLAAGETLLTFFSGTAWAVATLLLAISGLITGGLMLQSDRFPRATGIVALITNATAFGFMIPGAGALLLLISTVVGLGYEVLLARDLLRLARG